jgi:hypothetical protein
MESGPLSQEQALALLRRTSDQGWIDAELSGPDGTAIINARTATAASTSLALQSQVDACMISTAPGGRPGVCVLSLSRQTGGAFIDIPKGYAFRTNEGIELRVTQPITVSDTNLAFDLYLETIRSTELVNTYVPAFDALAAQGDLMPAGPAAPEVWSYVVAGAVKVPVALVIGPGAPDDQYSLRYAGSTCITLASSDWLSVHGNERGQRRQEGETVEEYRARIRLFPDAVSPIAIATAAHAAGRNAWLPDVYLLETVNPQVSAGMLAQYSLAFADSFFWEEDYLDDPVGVALPEKLPFRSLEMLSIREGRAYFRLAMNGPLTEPDGGVFYFDDGYLDDEVWGYLDGGLSQRMLGALMTVPASVSPIKAGGVMFDYYIEDVIRLDEVGEVAASAPGTSVFADSPGAGKAWILRDGLVTISGPLDPATDAFRVGFLLIDSSVVETDWISEDSVRLGTYELERIGYACGQIANIVVTVKSSVSSTLRAVGTFWVTEMTL